MTARYWTLAEAFATAEGKKARYAVAFARYKAKHKKRLIPNGRHAKNDGLPIQLMGLMLMSSYLNTRAFLAANGGPQRRTELKTPEPDSFDVESEYEKLEAKSPTLKGMRR